MSYCFPHSSDRPRTFDASGAVSVGMRFREDYHWRQIVSMERAVSSEFAEAHKSRSREETLIYFRRRSKEFGTSISTGGSRSHRQVFGRHIDTRCPPGGSALFEVFARQRRPASCDRDVRSLHPCPRPVPSPRVHELSCSQAPTPVLSNSHLRASAQRRPRAHRAFLAACDPRGEIPSSRFAY